MINDYLREKILQYFIRFHLLFIIFYYILLSIILKKEILHVVIFNKRILFNIHIYIMKINYKFNINKKIYIYL